MTAQELKRVIVELNNELNEKSHEMYEAQKKIHLLMSMMESAKRQLKELENNQ